MRTLLCGTAWGWLVMPTRFDTDAVCTALRVVLAVAGGFVSSVVVIKVMQFMLGVCAIDPIWHIAYCR